MEPTDVPLIHGPEAEPAADVLPALSARTAATTAAGQLAGGAALLLLSLAGTAIVTRALGVERFADWAAVLTIYAMLSFALDPGISPVIVRRIHYHDGRLPSPGALLRRRLVIAALAYVTLALAALALRGRDTFELALVLGAQAFPRTAVMNAGAWLQAEHRLHRQTALEVMTTAVGVAGLAVAALLDASPEVLALVGFVLPMTLLAVLVRRELRHLPSARITASVPAGEAVRSLFREVGPIAGAVALVAIYTRVDVFFVSAYASAAELAEYLLAFRFIEQLIVVAGILAATLLPMLAARGRTVRLFDDRLTGEVLALIGGAGVVSAAALILLAHPLVDVLGGRYDHAALFVFLLAPMATALYLNFLLGYLFMALELGRRYLVLNAFALAFNLVTNAIFTPDGGAAAAARLTWITELLVVAGALVPFWRAGPTGRSAVIRTALLVAIVVAASEIAAAGGSNVLAGLGALVLAAPLAVPPALRLGREVRRGGAPPR